jgi:hypothetical protein
MRSIMRLAVANSPVWGGLLCAALLAALTGCYSAVVYHAANKGDDSTGIRYYQSAPYVLIYSDGKGGLNWQIVYLPDQTKLMTVAPTTFLGKSQMSLSFINGTLTSGGGTGDTTTIPAAIFAAVQGAIPLLSSAVVNIGANKGILPGASNPPVLPPLAPPPKFPAPYLYKIVVEGGSVEFIGDQGTVPIRVPIANGLTNPIPVP